jgi:hypothetical protein
MANLDYYNKLRSVPQEAKKEIVGGRIKGMTDINPMWRIKTLTDVFGVCGIGWKYVIKEQKLEKGANEEISAFVTIDLFIKVDGAWSDAIPGVGGSSFVAKEASRMYVSDECFKMALTDALSVSCKALGVGADVYFAKDNTKYDKQEQPKEQPKEKEQAAQQPKEKKSLTAESFGVICQYMKGAFPCDINGVQFATRNMLHSSISTNYTLTTEQGKELTELLTAK